MRWERSELIDTRNRVENSDLRDIFWHKSNQIWRVIVRAIDEGGRGVYVDLF